MASTWRSPASVVIFIIPPRNGEGDHRRWWRGALAQMLRYGARAPPPCFAWSPSPDGGGSCRLSSSHQCFRFVVHRADDVVRLEDHVGVRRARRDHRETVGEFGDAAVRSEEHTSELQSLMRIPYADFCL